MTKKKNDRAAFLDALRMWDRPEGELFGRPLPGDTDTDALVDSAFTSPTRGIIKT